MRAPSAKRKWLVLFAGLLWTAVGAVLAAMACYWFAAYEGNLILPLALGIVGGVAIFWFGFSRLAAENLTRIYTQAPGKEKVCLFAFQNKRSYFMVVIMMAMGYAMRHSPLPKIYLAPFYLAIGLALALASLLYYRHLL
ncbi:MAG: hypothetical protein ABIJ61_07870 [bacterium]